MTRILTIIGARPQFVKASVVSKAISDISGIKEIIVHTGQHFDVNMSDIFFNQLQIPKPTYSLNINGGTHGEMTGRMILEIEKVLMRERPDRVLVYGDTNSTLAGALAAAKLHIPVAHVEAGLRSFDRKMPEEINRILTDQLSDVLFCPTDGAIKNITREGLNRSSTQVINVGDVMLDSAMFFSQAATPPAFFRDESNSALLDRTSSSSDPAKGFILSTLHRAENTDDLNRLRSLVRGLNEVHELVAPVVMPLHPRTRAALSAAGLTLRVNVIEPVGYMEMIWLLRQCNLVITDSGGLQKEAFFFKKFCVTMRDRTEWNELIEIGANVLVNTDKYRLVQKSREYCGAVFDIESRPYGDGQAAQRIAQILRVS